MFFFDIRTSAEHFSKFFGQVLRKSALHLDMDRLYRILGADFVNNWILDGSMTDNLNPWAQRDLSTYDTPEKRMEIVADEYQYTRTTRGTMMVILHENYTLAFIELAAEQVEFE